MCVSDHAQALRKWRAAVAAKAGGSGPLSLHGIELRRERRAREDAAWEALWDAREADQRLIAAGCVLGHDPGDECS